MKFKDYYEILGVSRTATSDEIKKAYRKLAHQYHPDVSKDPAGEEKFKEIGEAYATLKDSEKRAAYDALGSHPSGQEFRPPPNWSGSQGGQSYSFDDIDLSDLFANFTGRRQGEQHHGGHRPIPVSYTHLDVYKRQIRDSASRIAGSSSTIKIVVLLAFIGLYFPSVLKVNEPILHILWCKR